MAISPIEGRLNAQESLKKKPLPSPVVDKQKAPNLHDKYRFRNYRNRKHFASQPNLPKVSDMDFNAKTNEKFEEFMQR